MIALWILLGIAGIIVLYLLFLGVCALFVKKKYYVKNSRFYRRLLVFNTRIALWLCGVKYKVHGEQKLQGIGRFLFVCNHRSNLDPLILWVLLDKYDIAFLSKIENFRIPFFGRFIRKCCFMDIDRKNPRNAIKTLRASSELLKANEVSIGVYPEGTRSKSKEMLKFHDGVLKIAQFANVPVVVATVRGTEKFAKRKLFQKTKVDLDILEIISIDKVRESASHDLADLAKKVMQEFLDKFDKD